MNKDNIHYNMRRIDSHNKTFNFVISPREPGKSTAIWNKVYRKWRHKGRPSIVLRRQMVDITETYITDIQDTINQFLPVSSKIKFEFKKGSIKEGVIDVTVEGRPFCRVIALSNPKSRIKSLTYDDVAYIVMDEFIVDNRNGEKYLTDEANKFRELYNTFLRCATKHGHTLKCYFMGNPYSVYNPYFIWLGVNLAQIKPGAFIVGKNYVVECYELKQELKDFIMRVNPLYELDDSYTRYAFDGSSINDINFEIIPKQPDSYKLKYMFRIQNKYLCMYHRDAPNRDIFYDPGLFWITVSPVYIGSKNVLAADFNNLVSGTTLLTTDIKACLARLKRSIATRSVSYQSIEAGYLTEAIYKLI